MPQMISCPYCGKLTDPNLEHCPHCGGRVEPKRMTPSLKGSTGSTQRQTCPNCHALVQDGDIICIACGTNLLTGQKIVGGQQAAVSVSAPSRNMTWIVAAVVLAILALLAGIFLFFLLTRDPVAQAIELSRAGKELEASTVLEKYLAKRDTDPRAHYEMGRIQWRMSQYSAAAVSFEKASQLQPGNKDAAWLAVVALGQPGVGADARSRQLAVLKRLTENDPRDVRAWRLTALLKADGGDSAGAREAIQHVLELAPGDSLVLQQQAIAKALEGDYAGAAQDLKSLPPSGDVQAALGFVADAQGNADEALANFKEAVNAGTSVRAETLARLGALLVARGNYEEATPIVNEANSADKSNAAVQFLRASCLRVNGLLPEAAAEYEAIGQAGGPQAAEALVRAADLYIEQGNPAKAAELLDKAEQTGKTSAAMHTIRGRLFAVNGEMDRALEFFRRALQLDAQYAPAHLESGLLYARRVAFPEAIAALENYIKALGERREGMHATEVELLIEHLKQAAGQTAGSGRIPS